MADCDGGILFTVKCWYNPCGYKEISVVEKNELKDYDV